MGVKTDTAQMGESSKVRGTSELSRLAADSQGSWKTERSEGSNSDLQGGPKGQVLQITACQDVNPGQQSQVYY